MKKHLYLFLIFMLWALGAQAQQSNLSLGFKGGVNYASYRTPDAFIDVYKGKLGFFVGGFANIGITEKFKVQPELLFAMQGARFVLKDIEIRDGANNEPKVGDLKKNINEATILLPIMARYCITETFYVEAGPQFGFILSNKEKIITSPTDDPNFNVPNTKDPDTFDAGLAFGAGYKLTENLGLNARYYFGLVKRDYGIYSSVLNIGLEYSL
ncbi:porin family protein [Aequorivita todarodis]|uniref:porin family protein n=1 Tax=Aequorivita todarodis TaxID=2036821 RepID=UPI002350B933|nr:porin family protein [Aequorivita todarodis]MDC8001930.1 porin family protein [Aequorivita todarodis]